MLLLLIVALVVYRPLYDVVPLVFDEWLAIPIARAVADPGLYPAGDLIVSAGLAGPFWLYRASGMLLRLGAGPELVWGVAFVACEGALFYAVWRLLRALRLAPAAAVVTLVVVAASPAYRGTLNWTQLPFFAFVTASAAVPLLLLAVAAAIEGKATRAFVLAAVTFDLHPGAGVIAAVAVVTALVVDAPRAAWGRLAKAALLGAAITVPNFIALARHGVGDAATRADALAIFPYFAVHVDPREYWREGYAFFAVLLAAGVWGTRALPERERRIARAVAGSMGALIFAYALNTETTRILPVTLMYLFRATWVLKPLLIGCACAGVAAWHSDGAIGTRAVRRSVMLVLVAATCVQVHVAGDALAAIGLGAMVLAVARAPLAQAVGVLVALGGVVLGAAALGFDGLAFAGGASQLTIIAVALVVMAQPDLLPSLAAQSSETPVAPARATSLLRPALATLALMLILPLLLPRTPGTPRTPWSPTEVMRRFRFLQPPPSVAGVYRWATDSSPRAALVATPPDDRRFMSFRAVTARGQYVTTADLNQLAYDPPSYVQAGRRLGALGVRVEAYDASGYARLTDDALRVIASDGVTHIILPAASAAQPRAFPMLYRDSSWVVFALSAPAPVAAP